MRDYKELMKAAVGKEELEVTPQEYANLIRDVNVAFDPVPQPPVKAVSNTYGFWTNNITIEYDHHASAYLVRLEEWRIRQNNRAGKLDVLQLYTATGVCKIKIQGI